jgi:hypothetical protein
MASLARQVKGDDPDKKGYPGPPGWGLGVRLQSHPVKLMFVEKLVKFEYKTETTKTRQHEQGLTSGNVERAVSV